MKNKKENFSFAKWLTNRDIEKLVTLFGLELMEGKDDPTKKRIIRGKDKDGYHIVAFCRNVKKEDADNALKKELFKSPTFKKFTQPIANAIAMLSMATGGSSWSGLFNNDVILNFDDFFVQELFSLKDEKEQIEYCRSLTKIYQTYMKQKFGTFYNGKKAAKYKSLYKEIKEKEEQNQENFE